MKIEDFNFAGHKAIVRVDFNVPLDENGNVTDDTRIRGALPTLKKVLADGGALIMMSHMGKPKGKVKPELSLSQIVKNVSDALGVEVKFAKDCGNADAEAAALKPGEALLLENLRFYPEEEGKPVGVEKGTPEYDAAKAEMKERQKKFAAKLASYADVYVMDAFGTAHRAQATTYGVAQFAPVACAGPLLAAELEALGKAMDNPARPMVAIVGGSKVSTKLPVLNSLLKVCDQLIVGGGIANTFIAAAGHKVGKSLCENDLIDTAKELAAKTQIPEFVDVVVGKEFDEKTPAVTKDLKDVADDDMIFDLGPKSMANINEVIKNAKTILWNGPVGVFEFDQFAAGTKSMADAIANSDAFSVAGGGDTINSIQKFGVTDKISYISTGGGAFLEFVEGKKLPAVEILEKRAAE